MVTPGNKFPNKEKITAEEIATRTVVALSRTVPPAMVGVMVIIISSFYYLYLHLYL